MVREALSFLGRGLLTPVEGQRHPNSGPFFTPHEVQLARNSVTFPSFGFGKRGLLEKGSFQKSPFSRDSREFRDSRVSRKPPDCGKQRRIRPFSRDSREFRDSRDSSSEKTSFVMTLVIFPSDYRLVTGEHWTGSPYKSIDQIGKIVPKMSENCVFSPSFWTFFGHFFDIFPTFVDTPSFWAVQRFARYNYRPSGGGGVA